MRLIGFGNRHVRKGQTTIYVGLHVSGKNFVVDAIAQWEPADPSRRQVPRRSVNGLRPHRKVNQPVREIRCLLQSGFGRLFGKLLERYIPEGTMRSVLIVIDSPGLDSPYGIRE